MHNIESLAQLFTVIIVFIFVVGLAYLSSRLAAGIQKNRMQCGNIQVLETMQIAANKYLQIVCAGEKYILIAVTKDNVTFLCELEKEQLEFIKKDPENISFKQILKGIQGSKVEKDEKEV